MVDDLIILCVDNGQCQLILHMAHLSIVNFHIPTHIIVCTTTTANFYLGQMRILKVNRWLVYFGSKPKSAPSKNADRARDTSLLCDARLTCVNWGQDVNRKSIMSQRGWLTHTRTWNYLWWLQQRVESLIVLFIFCSREPLWGGKLQTRRILNAYGRR